jgi:hypothetical protein
MLLYKVETQYHQRGYAAQPIEHRESAVFHLFTPPTGRAVERDDPLRHFIHSDDKLPSAATVRTVCAGCRRAFFIAIGVEVLIALWGVRIDGPRGVRSRRPEQGRVCRAAVGT